MKKPFVDYKIYEQSFITTGSSIVDNIKTTSRSTTILSKFIGKSFSVHNGKTLDRILIVPAMVGQKLGSFVLTKKLGNSIHNSEHNRKTKEKARRKITQKKVRKSTTVSKSTKNKSKKKK